MLRKPYYLQDGDLRDAVEKINILHSWINNNVDAMLDVLRNARFKADGGLWKPDNEKMRAILDTTPFRAYLNHMVYSTYLETDIVSTIKEKNCDIAKYLKVTVLLMDNGNVVENVAKLSHYDYGTLVADMAESARLYDLASKAEDAYRSTEFKLSLFTKR
jgi:hypothetical protein